MGVHLKEPLQIGVTYDLTFLAMTRYSLAGGKGNLHFYLSETTPTSSNYEQGTMIWGDYKNGKIGKKGKIWHRYRTSFVADKAYEFLTIESVGGGFLGRNSVSVDDLSLTVNDRSCTGNVVQNGGFEQDHLGAEGWREIQRDYGPVYQPNPSGDLPHVMTSPHSGGRWYTLTSFQGAVRADAAVEAELAQPLVVGKTYRLSFWAATDNNLVHNKGEIRVVANTQQMTWGQPIYGTTIMGDTKVDGNTEEWHYMEQVFTASDAFTHVAFQARSGYHVDIDDVCITSDPFTPGVVQFALPEYDVTESRGPGTVTLERVDGNGGSVTVDLTTILSGGTATPNVDYTPVTTTVTFADGQTTATVQIPILDDSQIEGNETIVLALSNPTNGATIGLPSATLNIIDDPFGKRSTTATTLEENILRRGKIVWASDQAAGGTVGSNDQLYYNEVRSTSPPKLIRGTAYARDPVWSHDGQYIAYVTSEPLPPVNGIASPVGDRLKIIDQDGHVYADYFAPTLLGATYLGAPEWADDGSKIVVPYYDTWPTTGLVTIDFSSPYDFAGPGTTVLVDQAQGSTALDPTFSPGNRYVYFRGTGSSSTYAQNTFLFKLDLTTPWLPPAILYGNGSLIEQALAPSIDRSGSKLIFGSSAWKNDPYEIYEDDEILSMDLGSGVVTRASAESENDLGSFAKGKRARDQFVRQNDLDGSHNDLVLQRGPLVLPFSTADDSNDFNDHAPDWVIPPVDIWNLGGTYDPGLPGVLLQWSDIIVDPTEPRVFTVDRSVDGINWLPVGTVQRTGPEQEETAYTFIDPTVITDGVTVVYYRIGLADDSESGGTDWSTPAAVTITCGDCSDSPDLH
jgi:hypothetical protein